uniref:Uncharacterized protein n=1 Tax=Aegilops tauschii subsp. strangulata TaxID=200361 RepID=A0A453SV23_AEGTS
MRTNRCLFWYKCTMATRRMILWTYRLGWWVADFSSKELD